MGSNDSKPAVGRSEYGRVKVALPPGKGLMDWVRLASGKTGQRGMKFSMKRARGRRKRVRLSCGCNVTSPYSSSYRRTRVSRTHLV
ncbi:hypothetical protein Y032_0007g3460 [Ancylostoma ceylanicum]|uniref:Uncharacterized protein n=1 Tax=Ancylostoma ceylanicum TaxID=53326 RepID=A0A016VQ05_9BILA|nr:hypothetical protein Y032_0007g3460 [Ancylostoma ceylanicum]